MVNLIILATFHWPQHPSIRLLLLCSLPLVLQGRLVQHVEEAEREHRVRQHYVRDEHEQYVVVHAGAAFAFVCGFLSIVFYLC